MLLPLLRFIVYHYALSVYESVVTIQDNICICQCILLQQNCMKNKTANI